MCFCFKKTYLEQFGLALGSICQQSSEEGDPFKETRNDDRLICFIQPARNGRAHRRQFVLVGAVVAYHFGSNQLFPNLFLIIQSIF